MVDLEVLNGMKLAADIINADILDVDVPLAKGAGLPKLNGAKVRIVAADNKDSADHARNEHRAASYSREVRFIDRHLHAGYDSSGGVCC